VPRHRIGVPLQRLARAGAGHRLPAPAELAGYLDREAAYYHALATRYRDLAVAKDRGEFGTSPQTRSLRMTVEASLRVIEALGGWADWASQQPPPR
jgi:hypothetical protein